jgi:hypothetical protein
MLGISPTRNKARWLARTRMTAGNLPGTSSLEIVVWEALRLEPRTSRTPRARISPPRGPMPIELSRMTFAYDKVYG